jgi:transcriptional regulator with XRE-family HTH domain
MIPRMGQLLDAIREAIKASGKTRYRIAQESGVAESVLSRLMSGERGLSADALERLADNLGLDLVRPRRKGARKMVKAKDAFAVFDREVRNIRTAWKLWQILTGDESQSTELRVLSETTPTFYSYAVWALLTSVVSGLARLGDPSKQAGRDNLTLEVIWQATEFAGRERLRKWAEKAKTQAMVIIASDQFRKVRSRVIAHTDRATATGAEEADLPIDTIRRAVHHVSSFQARIEAARLGKDLRFDTGEGAFADPADVSHCIDELVKLGQRLN